MKKLPIVRFMVWVPTGHGAVHRPVQTYYKSEGKYENYSQNRNAAGRLVAGRSCIWFLQLYGDSDEYLEQRLPTGRDCYQRRPGFYRWLDGDAGFRRACQRDQQLECRDVGRFDLHAVVHQLLQLERQPGSGSERFVRFPGHA